MTLSMAIITVDDLKRIGHKTPRTFLKMLDESEIGSMAKTITQSFPQAITDTSDYRKLIEQNRLKIARMDYAEILTLLKVLRRLEKVLTSGPSNIFKMLPDQNLAYMSRIPIDFISLYIVASLTLPFKAGYSWKIGL